MRLNRRLAPGIYLGVASVREQDGRLFLANGPGLPESREGREVDVVVVMERIPRAAMLDRLLESGAAGEEHIARVVDLLVPFYRASPESAGIDRLGSPEAIRRNVAENFTETEAFIDRTIGWEVFRAIESAQLSFLELERSIFEERVRDGWIRDGHGDLRAEHVAFLPDPVIVDCIEFADRFRYADVACDLAFLVMDLEFLGHSRLAEALVARFGEAMEDPGLDRVLGFYISYRAYVRGKVDSIKLAQPEVEPAEKDRLAAGVAHYFALAHHYAQELRKPLLILVGGLSGTGKSTLARLLAKRLGAVLIRSDVVRKELAGLSQEHRDAVASSFASGLYSSAMTSTTYATLAAMANEVLPNGGTVIVDATFSRDAERAMMRRVASEAGADLVHLECQVPGAVAAERMRRRAAEGKDASDATESIQEEQRAAYEPPGAAAVRLDTSRPPEAVLEAALAALRSRAREDRGRG